MSPDEHQHTFTFGAYMGAYAVAFLDLLGQKDAMRSLEPAFTDLVASGRLFEGRTQEELASDPAVQAVMAALSRSVLVVRRFFERYELIARDTQESLAKSLANAPPSERMLRERTAKWGIKHLRFSDGLVLYTRMQPVDGQGLGMGLLNLLMTCGYLWICQLADGQPIRGGLDVAVGVELDERELLGPALVRAYTLESEIADYPRVVVGSGVGQFCERMLADRLTDEGFAIDQKVAYMMRGLLCQASDGVSMIDVLGKPFREIGPPDLDRGTIQKAQAFVDAESARWQAQDSERGRRLGRKYSRLATYFETRLGSSVA